MNAINFIYTRFSIVSKRSEFYEFYTNRRDFEKYKSQILDKARLVTRLNIFANYQLPMLNIAVSQGMNIYHYVVTSIYLPDDIKNILLALQQQYSFLHFDFLDEYAVVNFEEKVRSLAQNASEVIICSSRLDDDDIILPDALHKMQPYMTPKFAGFALSFSQGYYAYYATHRYIMFANFRQINNAAGLSYIAYFHNGELISKYCTPYGDHTTVDRRMPTIVDGSESMFVYTYHSHNCEINVRSRLDDAQIIKWRFRDIIDFNVVNTKFYHIFTNYVKSVKSNAYLIQSWQFSFLAYKDNILIQTYNPCEALVAYFTDESKIILAYGDKYINLTRENQFDIGDDKFKFTLNHVNGNEYGIKIGDKYISSIADSLKIAYVSHLKRWEKFKLVQVTDSLNKQNPRIASN